MADSRNSEQAHSPGSAAPTTTDRIIEAATKLFAERGYAETTISQLSEAAGVSRALLFFHFGSKEGILDAVVNRARDEVADVFEHVGALKGVTALSAFLEARTTFFQQRPHVARLVMVLSDAGASQRSSATFLEFQNRRVRLLTRCLGEAVDDGTLRPDINVAEFALLLAAATDGDLRMWAKDPESRPIERTHAAILHLLELLGAPSKQLASAKQRSR